MDCRPPGSSIHGISQARILEWVSISFSRGSSQPRDQTWSPTLQADALTSEPPGKPIIAKYFKGKSYFFDATCLLKQINTFLPTHHFGRTKGSYGNLWMYGYVHVISVSPIYMNINYLKQMFLFPCFVFTSKKIRFSLEVFGNDVDINQYLAKKSIMWG